MTALVVIPTYEEAGNIEEALRRTFDALPDAHVLVVDDGSPDGTADIVRRIMHEDERVALLERRAKAGLGSAYRDGFQWGLERGYDAVIEMDADLSHDPGVLPSLLEPLGAPADLVIGSRYVAGGSLPPWNRWRRGLSRWGNAYASRVLGMPVRDATSGYRAYRADTLRGIDFVSSRANGYGFQIEGAYRTHRWNGTIIEVPIHFSDRTVGSSKMSVGIVAEALIFVTWWAVRDRLLSLRRRNASPRGTPPRR